MSELRSCPFCGSPVEIESAVTEEVIRCTLCHASMFYGGSQSALIEMWNTRPQAPEAPEDWEKGLSSMLNGMTFPDQIVSYVKALLKAEREKVLGEIEGVMVIDGESAWEFESRVIGKIAEIRGEGE